MWIKGKIFAIMHKTYVASNKKQTIDKTQIQISLSWTLDNYEQYNACFG